MSFRSSLFVLAVATALVSGCAWFSSGDDADAPLVDEIAVDEDLAPTNAAPAVTAPAAPVQPPPRNSVTSLHVADRPSPNFDKRTLPVSLIVLHYTAAPLKESLNVLRNGNGTSRVSSHYVVSQNGTIYRLVDESNRAWHAGVSRWKGITDVNSASIGIEMVNLGHDRLGRARPYTAAQVEAVTRLCLDIQSRYDITDVVGHSDVAPMRKIDPGERFPWRKLYRRGVKVSTKGFVP